MPWKGVLVGLIVLLGLAVPGMLAIQPLFARGSMETVMDFVLGATAFVGVAAACSWMASWACEQAVRKLAPYRSK